MTTTRTSSFLHYILCMVAVIVANIVDDVIATDSDIWMAKPSPPPLPSQTDGGDTRCGGVLRAAHGVIQTPHFPNTFAIPIECVWVIDASELATTGPNVSIVVYLTQLYVLGGLTFTEYMYYSDDYKVPSQRVFQLTEDDVTQVSWIQFTSQYLEIKFQMRSLDGTHLRALDRLLDVYGFNITYEVDAVKPYQCNALQCRFLGDCYARQDFTSYYCECYPGFSGSDCGQGPLCDENACLNGGTCKHIGDAAVTCHCPAGFKGTKCEIPEIHEITLGCTADSGPNCHEACHFGDVEYKPTATSKSRSTNRNGKTRFEVTIRLGTNLTALYRSSENLAEKKLNEHFPTLLERHLSRVLRNFNITKVSDLELISNSSNRLDITFHFFGAKADSTRIRDAITRMVERGRLGNITLVSNYHLFDENPPLHLQDIGINRKSPIREGTEFIISCVAQGSPRMQFQWYKDGVVVNATKAIRDIWTTVLPPDQKSVFTAILGISKANPLDEGVYTCKVSDWGVEQCRSTHIRIQTPPRLQVNPASVTLYRGEALRVRCLSPGNDKKRYGHLGYSWTRNGVLFQSDPKSVMWEDLYPDGSILKINNIQKSAEFACIVSNSISPVSKSVYVTVIDKGVVELCAADRTYAIDWPTSAPGAAIFGDCPKRYQGFSRRICEQRDIGNSTWLQPDFSNCISNEIFGIHDEFKALTLGYARTNCSALLKSCLDYTINRNMNFFPGEAGFLMDLLQEIESYLETKGTQLEREMAAEIILHILDRVMQNIVSLNSQQQIKKLQMLTQSSALNRETISASQLATSTSSSSSSASSSAGSASVIISSSSSSASSAGVAVAASSSSSASVSLGGVEAHSLSLDRLNSLRIYMTSVKMLPFNLRIYGDELFSDQLHMDIGLSKTLMNIMANSTIFASVISYKNLKSFLPKTYYSRGSDTKDSDYIPASRIIQTWLFQSNRSNDNFREPLTLPFDAGHVEIIFQHESRPWDSEWIPACGYDDRATFESTWRTDLCITKHLMENLTRCICPLSGTFVVLLAKKNYNTTTIRTTSQPMFIVISCGCCFIQSATAFALLIPIFYNRKCCLTFLKMQFCISTSSVMAILLFGFLKLLPSDWHGIISSTLASLMLLGISTLIAITLIIQSELVPQKLQMTTNISAGIRGAIGISWLLPLLYAICSPLISSIIGEWPMHWWLQSDTSGFVLFIIVEILFILLFVLLFVTLIKKLLWLLRKHDKHNSSIWRRIGLLYRTGAIMLLKLAVDALFLCYVNMTDVANPVVMHAFGFCCVLLGFSVLFCFVIKAEYSIRSTAYPMKKASRKTSLEENYCSNSINSPLSFFAGHEMEKDNESLPPSSATTHLPLTIISTMPRCTMVDRIQTTASTVETFLGVVGVVGTNGVTVAAAGGGDNKKTASGICDISLHEMEMPPNGLMTKKMRSNVTEAGRNITGIVTTANDSCNSSNSSSNGGGSSGGNKSRCCNILSSGSSSSKHDLADNHGDFYDVYGHQKNQLVNCGLPSDGQGFVGVETLDILQGVSTDSIIGIRTTTTSINLTTASAPPPLPPPSGVSNLLHHRPFVETPNNGILTTSSSVTTQTPKSQKRVTIIEEPKMSHTFDPIAPSSDIGHNLGLHHHHQQQQHPAALAAGLTAPPIITITTSSIDTNDGGEAAAADVDDGGNTLGTPTDEDEEEDSDAIDGVMDRISHDLDYLLNRTAEVPTRTSDSPPADAIPPPPLPPAASSITSQHCRSVHHEIIVEESEQE